MHPGGVVTDSRRDEPPDVVGSVEESDFETLALNLKRAVKATKPWYWGFVMKGADGEPHLLVEKKEALALKGTRVARKTASDKKFATGEIRVADDGTPVFGIGEGSAKAKLIEKAFKLKLAKSDELKRVKSLIRKAEILDGDAFEARFGGDQKPSPEAPTSSTSSPTTPAEDLKKWKAKAKAAYDAAKARLDGKSFEAKLVERTKKEAFEVAKGDDIDESISWFKTLCEVCDEAGTEVPPEADDGETQEDWLDEKLDVSGVDPEELLAVWRKGIESIDPQLNQLVTALKQHENALLNEIGELGLNALTAGFRTKLQAALLEAKLSKGPRREAALKRAVSLADKFVDHVYDEPRFEACDRNPLTGPLTVRRDLGRALRTIANAG